MAVIGILKKASKVLKEFGWCQGVYENEHGQCCLVGALRKAAGGPSEGWASRTRGAREVIRLAIRRSDITDYNDAHGRKKETILRAIDRAIEIARQRRKAARRG